MKKILFVNSVFGYGSTGKIVLDLAKGYESKGYDVKIAYGRCDKINNEDIDKFQKYGVRIGINMDVYFHVIKTRLLDKHGLASKGATKAFIKWADEYDPDEVWLHNLHGYYINYEMLFAWIKSRPKMQVKWTLHDCWAFTGHCTHFMYPKCDKWKDQCYNCPEKSRYPQAITDNSKDNYVRKKRAFTGVSNLTLITPSEWLKSEVEKSFLSEYPVQVVCNRIDESVFKPTPSSFKQDHGLEDKKIILGVANGWNKRKGLDDFVELSHLISKANRTDLKVVLVGLTDAQIKAIKNTAPDILALPRTSNAKELAKIYSAADVFVNPTYEDNYPTVNLEAEACGTPVISYDTGGCRETIKRPDSFVVEKGPENLSAKIIEY